jgi:hypothetical protein
LRSSSHVPRLSSLLGQSVLGTRCSTCARFARADRIESGSSPDELAMGNALGKEVTALRIASAVNTLMVEECIVGYRRLAEKREGSGRYTV